MRFHRHVINSWLNQTLANKWRHVFKETWPSGQTIKLPSFDLMNVMPLIRHKHRIVWVWTDKHLLMYKEVRKNVRLQEIRIVFAICIAKEVLKWNMYTSSEGEITISKCIIAEKIKFSFVLHYHKCKPMWKVNLKFVWRFRLVYILVPWLKYKCG